MGEQYRSSLPGHVLSRSDKRQSGHSHERPRRLYQVWKGRNKFCLGGRFIFGPDVRSIFLTLSLILVPVILFWAFVAKGLIATFSDGWGTAIVVLSIVLTINIIILLLLTSGRDPGIIPRNSYPMEFDDFDTFSLATDWGGSQSSATGFPLRRSITINGIIVRVKYCQTCKLYRPPRCSHCSICNNCVERFDHHCPWIGQCIGKRNYRHFFMFVSSTTLLCLYVLTSCLINISRTMDGAHCSMWRAIQKSPVSGILIVYTFVVCWFVGGLTVFHLYLIATNQTTYENFRYQYNQKLNPYNLGFDGNCKEVFCYKIPRSRNDFRENVKVESCTGSSVSSYLAAAATTPEIMKLSLDVEMESRQCVDDVDEFERIRRVGSLERCGTQPRRYDDCGREDNWERNPEKYIFSSDFGSEDRIKDRQEDHC